MVGRWLRDLILLMLLAGLAGCVGSPAPVYERSYPDPEPPVAAAEGKSGAQETHYVVRRGDTLYSIAWRYGLDFRTLAGWNGIGAPYTIYPDQRLVLTAPAAVATAPAPSAPSRPEAGPKPTAPATGQRTGGAARPPTRTVIQPPTASSPIQWRWPADGPLLASFSPGAADRRGVDIGGQPGDLIRAAADGEVVYSGVGLIGYGELIIIKHDAHFLSAYAHNRKRLVSEGETVKGGQRIAEMGDTGTDRTKLHFEIRKDGQPVDPRRYLPRR